MIGYMGVINYIAGVDYSMTSPAICIHKKDEPFTFETCKFFFLTEKKKISTSKQFVKTLFDIPENYQERYNFISNWALDTFPKDGTVTVYMEDYSFGSTGMVFNIAENTGCFKFKMWQNNIPFNTISPGALKKFGSGKGNATKFKMEQAFTDETKYALKAFLGESESSTNPSSDLIDAYYACKYGHVHENKT